MLTATDAYLTRKIKYFFSWYLFDSEWFEKDVCLFIYLPVCITFVRCQLH